MNFSRQTPVLGQQLDLRRNSLNAIRLVFAWWVVVEHAFELGGFREAPHWIFYEHETVGTYALAAFFVLSGYLIYASRLASGSTKEYLWRRGLRMFPGYWVCLFVVAFVIAPASQLLARSSSYDLGSGIGYVAWNSLLKVVQIDISDTLGPETGIEHPYVWNFSLWTLFWEFVLYVGLALIFQIFRRRVVLGLWLAFAGMTIFKIVLKLTLPHGGVTRATETAEGFAASPLVTAGEPLSRLGIFFFAGALMYHYRDRVRLTPAVVAVAAVAAFVLAIVGWFHVVGAIPWAIVILRLGASVRASRLNHPNDYSYGTYIWAFPITQMLALWAVDHPMSEFWFCTTALVITMGAAWLSWHLVEKRALRLKHLVTSEKKSVPVAAPPAS